MDPGDFIVREQAERKAFRAYSLKMQRRIVRRLQRLLGAHIWLMTVRTGRKRRRGRSRPRRAPAPPCAMNARSSDDGLSR